MKLTDWAKKQGISYLTAYRWFRDGKLPVTAYQSDSGTIIVQDDDISEQAMSNSPHNDVMSAILKKTVEFSKNNGTVAEFAAYILSNFSLKFNHGPENPKYSRVKPKPEDIQNHFKQFIKPKGEKPKPNMFMADASDMDDALTESSIAVLVDKADHLNPQQLIEEIRKIGGTSAQTKYNTIYSENIVLNSPSINPSGVFENAGAASIVSRNVDLTPQQLDYTNSINYVSSPVFAQSDNRSESKPSLSFQLNSLMASSPTGAFKPTQKELESAPKSLESVNKPLGARRGRKSHKVK